MIRPKLPTAGKLIPYLERLDESRIYSNFGELNAEYQERLGGVFGAPCVTGSSATSLLTAALMAYDLPRGSLVAMPSWTFPATAAAVVGAGHVPYFCDVGEDGILAPMPLFSGTPLAAVVVVAPFGVPLDLRIWDDYEFPVIVDAAAGFDAFSTVCKPSKYPVVVSTHATKALGTGEGGFITCHDKPLLEKIRRITNFGLSPDRRIEYNGLNAKFSEYHAAVGLASLDWWPEKRKLLMEAVKPYGLDYAVTQVPVRGGEGRKGVYGCHIHDAYKDYPRGELPVTNDLIDNIRVVTVGIE